MKVAIHQPNFIPWMPFFDKIESADVFVLLGNCQFEKGGFQNRFRLSIGSEWHTMSIRGGLDSIINKRYSSHSEDWARIRKAFPRLEAFDDLVSDSLWNTNVAIIRRACEMLGIQTQIEEDWPTEANGGSRLVEICKRFGAKKYLSGSSGPKYMDLGIFKENGIEVEFHGCEDKRSLAEVV